MAGKALCGPPTTLTIVGVTTVVVAKIAEVVVVVVVAEKEIGAFEFGQADAVIVEIICVQSRLLVVQSGQGCD